MSKNWIKLFGLIVIIGLFILVVILIYQKIKSNSDKSNYITVVPRQPIDAKLRSTATTVKGTTTTPIYILDNFMRPDECTDIIAEFKGKFIPSPLTRKDPNDNYFRTSKTVFFDDQSPLQKYITNKILTTIGLDEKLAEKAQIQHYEVGNEFKAHWDWFHEDADKPFFDRGQRIWTFMIYLNDVEEGGETHFTKLDQSITPKLGRAVIWSNLDKNGKVDYETQHAGTPVKKGQKYVITKWFKLEKNPS